MSRNQTRKVESLRVAGPLCRAVFLFLIAIGLGSQPLFAQNGRARPQKLPSAEKVVEKYLKAIGGRKRVVAIREVSVEYALQGDDQPEGVRKLQTKEPTSRRPER